MRDRETDRQTDRERERERERGYNNVLHNRLLGLEWENPVTCTVLIPATEREWNGLISHATMGHGYYVLWLFEALG